MQLSVGLHSVERLQQNFQLNIRSSISHYETVDCNLGKPNIVSQTLMKFTDTEEESKLNINSCNY